MKILSHRHFWRILGLSAILTFAATELQARCMIRIWIGDRFKYIIINNGNCTDINHPNPPQCIDLPIAGGLTADVKSATEAYVVIGKEKYLLTSDEAQAKFDAMWQKEKGKIDLAELERELASIMRKSGVISAQRIKAIIGESGKQDNTKSTWNPLTSPGTRKK